MRALLSRLVGDARGGTLMTFAIALPALVTLGLGVIDLASVNADKSRQMGDGSFLPLRHRASHAASQWGVSDRGRLRLDP